MGSRGKKSLLKRTIRHRVGGYGTHTGMVVDIAGTVSEPPPLVKTPSLSPSCHLELFEALTAAQLLYRFLFGHLAWAAAARGPLTP